jgi:hypothetical protein
VQSHPASSLGIHPTQLLCALFSLYKPASSFLWKILSFILFKNKNLSITVSLSCINIILFTGAFLVTYSLLKCSSLNNSVDSTPVFSHS